METGCEGMRGWSGLVTGAPNKLTSTSACRTSSCSLSTEDLVQISPPPLERRKKIYICSFQRKKVSSHLEQGQQSQDEIPAQAVGACDNLEAVVYREDDVKLWSICWFDICFIYFVLLHYSPPEKRWRQPGVPAEIYQQHPTFLLWYINFDNIHGLFEEIPNQLNWRALLPKT